MRHAWLVAQLEQTLNRPCNQLLPGVIDSHQLWYRYDCNEAWRAHPRVGQCEADSMQGVQQRLNSHPIIMIHPEKAVDWACHVANHPLSMDQIVALRGLLTHSLVVLHGGPGTGKTT